MGVFKMKDLTRKALAQPPMVAAALPFCFAAKVGAAISCGNRKNAGSDVQSIKLPWSGAALACHRQAIHSRACSNPSRMPKQKQTPDGRLFLFWLGMKDLNPHKQSQSLSCCHYTNPQYLL